MMVRQHTAVIAAGSDYYDDGDTDDDDEEDEDPPVLRLRSFFLRVHFPLVAMISGAVS